MASRLLDQFGNPHQGYGSGGGRLIGATRRDSSKGPQEPTRMESITSAVTYFDWRTMISASRRLWANFDVLKGATGQKAMHAIGRAWTPIFLGDDKKWGELAAAWLENEWYHICDVRGSVFDFKTGLFLDSISFDRDGDNAVLLAERDDGYPQIQRLACHRIGQHSYSAEPIKEADAESCVAMDDGSYKAVPTLYAGMRIELGCIYNRAGRTVGHRVIGDRGAKPQDISTRDLDLRFDPEYVDQARGFPAFSGSINQLAGSFTAHQYELQALLMQGSTGINEWNEAGGQDTTAPEYQARFVGLTDEQVTALLAADSASGRFSTEYFEGAMTRYYKAGSNCKTEFQPSSARPGDPWDSFQDRLVRAALSGMNWPYSLVWKPEGMNGTQERSAIEQARAAIKDRQDLLMPRARRIVGYAVAKAIKLGILPEYTGQDAGGMLRWGFEMPPEFNIDHGREDASWLSLYNAGAATLQSYLDANARGTVKAFYLARANEDADRQEAIATVEAARKVKIDPRNIRQVGPNDQAADPQGGGDAGGNSPATNLDDAVKGADDDEHDPHI